jgi:hypothetical protein
MVSQMLTSDHRPLGCVVGVAALLVAGSSTGLLQPERYGTTLAHRMAFASADRLSGDRYLGIGDSMALRRDDLVPDIPLGDRGNAHVVDPAKSRGPRESRRRNRLFACRAQPLHAGTCRHRRPPRDIHRRNALTGAAGARGGARGRKINSFDRRARLTDRGFPGRFGDSRSGH